jgi:hypothetical protein
MPHREQRRFPRIAAHATMMIESLQDTGLGEFARTSSIGRGGCSFRSDEALEVGSELMVSISAGDEVVRVRARVAHAERSGDAFEVGVEFLDFERGDQGTLDRLLEGG